MGAMAARDGQHVVPAERQDSASLQSLDRHRNQLRCSVRKSVGCALTGRCTAVEGWWPSLFRVVEGVQPRCHSCRVADVLWGSEGLMAQRRP
jgi:hypothetical protein